MTDQPAAEPTFVVERHGDWEPRPSPLDGIPREVLEASAVWLRDGGPLTDPTVAALIHAQHVALITTLGAAMDKVDAALKGFHDQYRQATAPLAGAARLSESYERGYQMGQVVVFDQALSELQRIQLELQRHNNAAAKGAIGG